MGDFTHFPITHHRPCKAGLFVVATGVSQHFSVALQGRHKK